MALHLGYTNFAKHILVFLYQIKQKLFIRFLFGVYFDLFFFYIFSQCSDLQGRYAITRGYSTGHIGRP